jgi:hypothetical protein
MTVNHPHAMFRTGTRTYTKRPPANCKTAQLAWDFLAKDGPIVWMTLLDGYWGAERPDGRIDEAENTFSSRYR